MHSTSLSRLRSIAAFTLLVVAVAPAVRAQAVPADAVLSDFAASGDYVLRVDDKPSLKAEIYHSEKARAILVIAPELDSPLLVNVPAKSVEILDLMKVSKRPDGMIDVLADAVLQPAGGYEIAGTEVTFQVFGRRVALAQKPWLLGAQTVDSMLAYSAEYQRRAKGYVPDAESMAKLRGERRDVQIRTFFGSWCPHCKKHVPLLLKVAQGLAGSKIQFSFYGLPSPLNADAEGVKNGIDGVPTAIVYIQGKEVGRIPNSQWANPEVGVRLILEGAKG